MFRAGPTTLERPPKDDAYERHKNRASLRQRAVTASHREISADLPPVKNPRRKARARKSLRAFCKSYFPDTFFLPFSEDHEKVIRKIERAVLHGGLFAVAMPRGSGKSALCAAACMWAALFGFHEFSLLIGATAEHAAETLDGIRTQLETNDLLLEDFPEACYPIRRLEGVTQRRLLFSGQTLRMKLTGNKIILPDVPGAACASAIIGCVGITGRIRGMKYTRPDGREVRPSLVMPDDPQTDESARMPGQVVGLLRIINGAVLGLAGPNRNIAGVMPCTVIANDDLADQLLDRARNPQWQAERMKMVVAWPTKQDLWDEYARVRAVGLREDRGESDGNAFYRKHRREMDEGAILPWPERKGGCLSGIQNAVNIRLDRKEDAFEAEYQNNPRRPVTTGLIQLTADQVASKLNNRPRGEVPSTCTKLTAFIDVHLKALYWMVCAWEPNFTGYVLDYGTWPDQTRSYFTLEDVQHTLEAHYNKPGQQGMGPEAFIYAGLDELTATLFAREFARDDGSCCRLDKANIDANWGEMTDLIYSFCRQSKFSGSITPSHGIGIGASRAPMSSWADKPGEVKGPNWVLAPKAGRAIKHVTFDANLQKSFVHSRLSTAMGDPGCLSLFGDSPELHKMLADHITSEKPIRTSGRGRQLDEWKLPPGGQNHLWDCLVGCSVRASMDGIVLPGGTVVTKPIKYARPTAYSTPRGGDGRAFFAAARR